MELTNLEVVVAFFASFLISITLTPIFRKVALRFEIVDVPNQQHKTHVHPTPYLGGLSIITTVVIGLSIATLLKRDVIADSGQLIILFAAPLLLGLVGLIDDILNLGAFSRLLFQSLSATFVAFAFFRFGWFGAPTSSTLVNLLISILWIVGVTNSLNFIDNLDGGAGGIVVVTATVLTVASVLANQYALASITSLIAGATLGFLVWNVFPARIYLGDSGALFLGSILAVLILRLDPRTPNAFASWFFACLLLAVPILDTSVAVVSRVLRGVSPARGGRDHLSHRLLSLGVSKKLTAITIWTLQVYFCVLGLTMFAVDSRGSLLIEIIGGASWLLLFVFFLKLPHGRA